MRFLLLIILWVLTPQGLQIGEIFYNNQKIKIMKFNLKNPAFLQNGSNVAVESINKTTFIYTDGINTSVLSANGTITIKSQYNGSIVENTYSDIEEAEITINSDNGSMVTILGDLTMLACDENAYTYIDVSRNQALESLMVPGCENLASLNLQKNINLKGLNCEGSCITSLDLSKTKIEGLFCGGLPFLESFNLRDTQSLEFIQGFSVESFPSLVNIYINAQTSEYTQSMIKDWIDHQSTHTGTLYVTSGVDPELINKAEAAQWNVVMQ